MTDEQKQKYKESEKRYRENMTDEQKQRDYQKEYRKNITDEQKQRYIKAIKIHQKKYKEKYKKLKSDIEKI